MLNRTTSLLSILLITTVAYGGEIYKWKDKDGQIHFGDSSSLSKMQSAEKVKLTGTTVTEAQRKEAEEIAARNRMQAPHKPTVTPIDDPDTSPAVQTVSAQTSDNSSPSRKKSKECQEAWRKYLESKDCFAQYVLRRGGVNGVAYQQCAEVRQPAEFCN